MNQVPMLVNGTELNHYLSEAKRLRNQELRRLSGRLLGLPARLLARFKPVSTVGRARVSNA